MPLVFDKHTLISGLSLPPSELQDPRAVGRRHQAETVLRIGLINNMPDSALQATERQFKGLLRAAAESNIIDLRYFSLASVKRSSAARSRTDRFYTDISNLSRLHLDGLIVTGAEPKQASLVEEAYWQEFIELIDWAEANTRSTIWSCLAAHAAVLHLDEIERRPLKQKCSGVFDCYKASKDWLTRDVPSRIKVSHSRLNELRRGDLLARGYRVITASREAGVDIFSKRLRSHFIFFQGHPEYNQVSLQREYRRDVGRFLSCERTTYPTLPLNYFDSETERELKDFEIKAHRERTPGLFGQFPRLLYQADIGTGTAAQVIFRNWLRFLADR